MAEKKNGLEENFKAIEELIDKLSDDSITLEEAFNTYSKGMELIKISNEQLDTIEKKVLKLSEDGRLVPEDGEQ